VRTCSPRARARLPAARGAERLRGGGGRGSGTGAERSGDSLGRRGLRMAAVRTLELNKPRGGRTTSGTGPRCSPSCDWSRGLRRRSQ
ncbi:mCG144671, partial [Mus musculus]